MLCWVYYYWYYWWSYKALLRINVVYYISTIDIIISSNVSCKYVLPGISNVTISTSMFIVIRVVSVVYGIYMFIIVITVHPQAHSGVWSRSNITNNPRQQCDPLLSRWTVFIVIRFTKTTTDVHCDRLRVSPARGDSYLHDTTPYNFVRTKWHVQMCVSPTLETCFGKWYVA